MKRGEENDVTLVPHQDIGLHGQVVLKNVFATLLDLVSSYKDVPIY
jgi:hypothetical protein